MANAPWHNTVEYRAGREALRQLAAADPHAICWRCERTLQDHEPHRNGRRPRWNSGHTGDRWNWRVWTDTRRKPPPGNWLALEAATCNQRASADATNGTVKFDPSIIAR